MIRRRGYSTGKHTLKFVTTLCVAMVLKNAAMPTRESAGSLMILRFDNTEFMLTVYAEIIDEKRNRG